MSDITTYNNIKNIYDNSISLKLDEKEKFVIFSDLHLGDGGRNDDFLRNSALFSYILENYYLKKNYSLILNGDIEDSQRFKFEKIYKQWEKIFNIFDKFNQKNKFYKIIGNHDEDLINDPHLKYIYKVHEGLRLSYKDLIIFIFHGYQASKYYMNHKKFIKFFLRYFANPMGINNYTVSHDSRKKFNIEQNVYDFTRKNKIISIVGHTHRPLFESLSKIDFIKYKIEELCRNYIISDNGNKSEIENTIREYKKDIESFTKKEWKKNLKDPIYGSSIVLPCLFNSGCVIGKRGITALEITPFEICLVHYFDSNISERHLHLHNDKPLKIDKTDFYRVDLNKDSLDYINAKLKIL
jgi:UDP-2,3-diacylglucosamine pyrophosphatase LpxH